MKGTAVNNKIVAPYADALMSIANTQGITEELGAEIRSLLNLLDSTPELRAFLDNPVLKSEDKRVVLRQIFGTDTNPYLVNFSMLLVDRRRIIFLEQIADKYLDLLRKQNNIVLAVVTSAIELSDSQKDSVVEKVKQLTGAQGVELSTNIDSNLIGGVVIKVGSQVFDASLRGQLRRISLSLMS